MKESISTKNLTALPKSNELKKICQSIAMLDAILEPDWEFRYYSFNSKWDETNQMASMRDGSGDHYFILFKPNGVIIKGFAHESVMGIYAVERGHPWSGVLNNVPSEFNDFLTEPAFSTEETSFCIWFKSSENNWTIGDVRFPKGKDPDGSASLLYILDGNPNAYIAWAEEYYDRNLQPKFVEAIYQHKLLTDKLVMGLNPNLSINDLQEDIIEIGYPFEG